MVGEHHAQFAVSFFEFSKTKTNYFASLCLILFFSVLVCSYLKLTFIKCPSMYRIEFGW